MLDIPHQLVPLKRMKHLGRKLHTYPYTLDVIQHAIRPHTDHELIRIASISVEMITPYYNATHSVFSFTLVCLQLPYLTSDNHV